MTQQCLGHFELLGWLDPCDVHQANLLIQALSGKELPFTDYEKQGWLPVAIGCVLAHPDSDLGRQLSRLPEELQKTGLAIVRQIFDPEGHIAQWNVLLDKLRQCWPPGISALEDHAMFGKLQDRWQKPPNDQTWEVYFGSEEARAYALLKLIANTGWAKDRTKKDEAESLVLFPDDPLSQSLALWLQREQSLMEDTGVKESSILWAREKDEEYGWLPAPTDAAFILDALIPDQGILWQIVTERFPVDVWILQGESLEEIWSIDFSQPSVLLSLYPKQKLPFRTRLSLGLYQSLILSESVAEGHAYNEFSLSRSRSRSLRKKLEKIEDYLEEHEPDDNVLQPFDLALEHFGYHYAAHDWFNEQAQSPDLMKRRGLRPGEPLPAELGLFDKQGRPLPVQHRQNWEDLQNWLENDNAILKFFFPEELSKQDIQLLKSDLTILKKQPWSPQAAVKAILTDWPKDEPQRPCTMEHSEARLMKACDVFIKAIGAENLE